MALTKEEIKNQFPIPAYNYKVIINNETVAFSQVSGLSMTLETSTYKESPVEDGMVGPVTRRMPGQINDITISLQKGVVRGKSLPALYEWINSAQLNLIEKKDIQIDLCDENGDAVIRWTVINAFPTSLEAPSFDASTSDAAIESMELMADRLRMEEL